MRPPSHDTERPVDLSTEAHRQLIGYSGLLLPALLYLVAGLRRTETLPAWTPLESITAYYYSGAIAVFVGVLFGLALFLLTYQGYSDSWEDRALGRVGAVCALSVALFPTGVPKGVPAPEWLGEATPKIHYTAAAGLFVVFILFSLWLFRRSSTPEGAELSPDKKARNRIYLGCGVVMIGCVVRAFVAGQWGQPIFWPETIALWAFATSWLVKGEATRSIRSAGKRAAEAMCWRAPRAARSLIIPCPAMPYAVPPPPLRGRAPCRYALPETGLTRPSLPGRDGSRRWRDGPGREGRRSSRGPQDRGGRSLAAGTAQNTIPNPRARPFSPMARFM